jgi:hypothetical protein
MFTQHLLLLDKHFSVPGKQAFLFAEQDGERKDEE